jgi:hypothetical protein
VYTDTDPCIKITVHGDYMIADPFNDDLPTLDDIDNGPVNIRSTGKVSAAQQGLNIPAGWKPTIAEPVPVVRCTGKIRSGPRQGERCTKWGIRGATLCIGHGGQLPNVKEHALAVVEAARMRMIGLADEAIDAIEDLVTNPTTSGQVRLKAATEILDRIGVKGAPDLAITVEHSVSPSETIAKKLASIALRLTPPAEPEDLGEVEDAEIIDEPEESPLESASTNK